MWFNILSTSLSSCLLIIPVHLLSLTSITFSIKLVYSFHFILYKFFFFPLTHLHQATLIFFFFRFHSCPFIKFSSSSFLIHLILDLFFLFLLFLCPLTHPTIFPGLPRSPTSYSSTVNSPPPSFLLKPHSPHFSFLQLSANPSPPHLFLFIVSSNFPLYSLPIQPSYFFC